MSQNTSKPHYILKGQNYYRYFAILLLTGIILLSFYSINLIGYISLTVTLSAVFGLLSIRFPSLRIFEDYFIIEKKGLIQRFNDSDVFKFTDLETVAFSKGFTNWSKLIILTLLRQAGQGGFSKPDQMIIKPVNKDIIIYNRFGNRKNFKLAIRAINEKSLATRNV